MKPIPAPSSQEPRKPDEEHSAASELISPSLGNYSASNRKSPSSSIQNAYPWLLILSTTLAVVFGMMYITKPVIVASDSTTNNELVSRSDKGNEPKSSGLLPSRDTLPGNPKKPEVKNPTNTSHTDDLIAGAPTHSDFEETNMRVQHILTAKAPNGHVSRIDIEVPVLYQSRNLRWSATEVTRARELMIQLMNYQDKTRQLKSEGRDLLVAWNELMGSSIPVTQLRADSPSLPENQEDAIATTSPIDTTTSDAIEIQTKEKKQ